MIFRRREIGAAVDAAAATLEVSDHVGVLTLTRPQVMNAVDEVMATQVGDLLEEADGREDVRVVVLTGAGRAFCAGADLKEMAAGRESYHPGRRAWDFAGMVRHWIAKPLIAAVNGFALGGGTEIALACDLIVIDENATLGLPEVTRGLVAGAGGLIRLQRQVPFKVASEIALTGQPVTAHRAYELGLVNRIAPAGRALSVALELAGVVAANAPVAVAVTKMMLHEAAIAGSAWGDESWGLNEQATRAVLATEDAAEGARAFVEKRPPVWRGA